MLNLKILRNSRQGIIPFIGYRTERKENDTEALIGSSFCCIPKMSDKNCSVPLSYQKVSKKGGFIRVDLV